MLSARSIGPQVFIAAVKLPVSCAAAGFSSAVPVKELWEAHRVLRTYRPALLTSEEPGSYKRALTHKGVKDDPFSDCGKYYFNMLHRVIARNIDNLPPEDGSDPEFSTLAMLCSKRESRLTVAEAGFVSAVVSTLSEEWKGKLERDFKQDLSLSTQRDVFARTKDQSFWHLDQGHRDSWVATAPGPGRGATMAVAGESSACFTQGAVQHWPDCHTGKRADILKLLPGVSPSDVTVDTGQVEALRTMNCAAAEPLFGLPPTIHSAPCDTEDMETLMRSGYLPASPGSRPETVLLLRAGTAAQQADCRRR